MKIKVFREGAWQSEESLRGDDRACLYGDGVFRTLLVAGGIPHFFAEHFAVFTRDAEAIGLQCPQKAGELRAAIVEILPHEREGEGRRYRLRLNLSRGRALNLTEGEGGETLWLTLQETGPAPESVRAVTLPLPRLPNALLSRIKSLSYLEPVLNLRAAQKAGADTAILMCPDGFIAEAATASVFISEKGRWLTPPVADGALPGVTRGLLLAAGAREERLTLARLKAAAAVFLTSSIAGAVPLQSLDGESLNQSPAHANELRAWLTPSA